MGSPISKRKIKRGSIPLSSIAFNVFYRIIEKLKVSLSVQNVDLKPMPTW